MATRTLIINYPDNAGTRIADALKAYYKVSTNAEAFAAFDQEVKDKLKAIVFTHERQAAAKAAEDAVVAPVIS